MSLIVLAKSVLALDKLGASPRLNRAKRLILQEMASLIPTNPKRSKYKYTLTADEEGWVEHYIANNGQGYVLVDGISVSPKIQTIKSVRLRNTAFGLKQAKDYVEAAIDERRARKQ